MTPTFAAKLGLSIRPTDIGAQKIDDSSLKMYGMVMVGFSIQGKTGKIRFFEGTFVFADTSMEIVLGMHFLTLSNSDIQFDTECYTWKSYITAKALPTSRRVKLINNHNFAKAALGENSKTFVVYVAALEVLDPAIHPSQAPVKLGELNNY